MEQECMVIADRWIHIWKKNGKIHHPTEPAVMILDSFDSERHLWCVNGKNKRPYHIYNFIHRRGNKVYEFISTENEMLFNRHAGVIGPGFQYHEKHCFPVCSWKQGPVDYYAYHGYHIEKAQTPWYQLQEWNSTTSTKDRLNRIFE